jgi:hypothetical protein
MMAVGVWRLVREDERLHALHLGDAAEALPPEDTVATERNRT